MMNGFLNKGPGLQHEMPMQSGQPLIDTTQGIHLRASSASPTWAAGFHNQPSVDAIRPQHSGSPFSPQEFARFNAASMSPASASSTAGPSVQQNVHHQPQMFGHGRLDMARPYPMMAHSGGMGYMRQGSPLHQTSTKGKEKVVELDDEKWQEEFDRMALLDSQQAGKEEEQKGDETRQNADGVAQSETMDGDFESIWRGIQAENATAKEMLDGEDQVDWNNLEFNDFDDWSRELPRMPEEYLFEEENMFKESSNAFDMGIKIMKEGGNLSLAALAFEAAVQQNQEHVEAWVYLGLAQAQNEKETAAIRALEQAVRLDPNNLEALMGLAVSYTNEGYDARAYRTLERWLSAKYPQIVPPDKLHPPAEVGFTEKALLHQSVTDNFIRAAQLRPGGESMDPDVQVGLGVLFYGMEEYDKAVDCFRAALDSAELGTSNQREQVHLLWNRLGATLANSGSPEEAIGAYQKALTLQPNFVRARYNLGVSCISIGCLPEAAGHFLAALEMHKSIEKEGRAQAHEILGAASGGGGGGVDEQLDRMSGQNRSTTLYDTLRRVFTQMQRRDLAEKVVVGVDPSIFRGEFDF